MANSSMRLNQWVSRILNVESKSDENMEYLQSILGPIDRLSLYDTQELEQEQLTQEINAQVAQDLDGYFTHEIVFKIDEKVFVEQINIYEKVCADSSLMRIEALNEAATSPEWVIIWKTNKPLDPIRKPIVFTPNIQRIAFKTDMIKITICGSIILIDGIEVKGNKQAIDEDVEKEIGELKGVNKAEEDGNQLFADVYFECEGKVIAAHRNILVSRSEYFRAMLRSKFAESKKSSTSDNPIYLKQLTYTQFMQVLSYLYTGHIDTAMCASTLLGLIRTADRMNLVELEQLCMYYLSESLNETNVIDVYVEANEGPHELDNVAKMCYDVMQTCFARVSRSPAFCALSQPLMLKIIENVVPKLIRLTSEQLQRPRTTNTTTTNINSSNNNTQNDSDNDEEEEEEDVEMDRLHNF